MLSQLVIVNNKLILAEGEAALNVDVMSNEQYYKDARGEIIDTITDVKTADAAIKNCEDSNAKDLQSSEEILAAAKVEMGKTDGKSTDQQKLDTEIKMFAEKLVTYYKFDTD